MKKFYSRLLTTILFLVFSCAAFSQSDIYESYVILDINSAGNMYYDLNVDTGNANFDGANLGTFTPVNSLVLNGAQNQTYKCGTHNIMNGFIDYRIYLASGTPGAFIPSEILYFSDDGTSNYCTNTSLDQTWESSGANIDLLNGLTSGDYILEVYTRAEVDYDNTDMIDTVDNTLYISNGGTNYSATFRVDNPPVANCQNITVQLDASGNASITGNDINNTSSDDFGIASLTASITNFTCADLGTNNITLTVTDSIGQTDTCIAVVTVEDSVQSATATITSLPASPICDGESVTFTATGTDLGINPQYEWFVGGISVGNNNATYTTTGLIDGDDVYVEITSISCTTVVTSSNSLMITVHQPPTADAGPDQVMCSNSTFDLIGTFGGSATSGSWAASSGGFVGNTYYPSISGGFVTIYYITNDPPGPCGPATDSMVMRVYPFRDAIASNTTTITDCNDTTIQLSGNRTGQWSAVSVPAGSSFSFSNINNPNATFTGESGITYDITWTTDQLNPVCFDEDTFTVSFPACGDFIDFDGINDNINFGDNNNVSGTFSIEAWIKPNTINSSIQTILSKRDANDLSTGFDLRLVNNFIIFRSNTFSISANGITSDRWYHVAVTYDGTTFSLYVDGILRTSSPGPNPIANSETMLLGAMSRSNDVPVNYYNGWMDEIRIWNIPLSTEQIREMMNQEIENNTVVRGSVLGIDIAGLNWNNLEAYYQMNQGTADVAAGYLVGDVGVSGRLSNIITSQQESAPLPYISANIGNWDNANTWLNGNIQMTPNTNSVDWNIVRTSHDVNSGNRPTTLLGLIVDSNTYSITNDQSLRITKYLKIDGTLDLIDESQLLQDTGSVVDYTGIGKLERDQQGTTNLFHYNFWSSPVSSAGSNYTLNSVLYDGTDVNFPSLTLWTTNNDADGSTIPVTMSSKWLFLYENYPEDSYADWNEISETTPIPVGLGFTMKGSGNSGLLQNYTFGGQPNNGTITTPITAGYQALVGNPYPSAIDGYAFIADNSTVLLDGTLYFWEQSSTSASHILSEYEGGYAYLNLLGGTAAVAPPGINGVGDANTIPRQYVPVGQGFFVTGNATGGTIQFNNNQRAFVKESSVNSIFLRNSNSENDAITNTESTDNKKCIRIDFVSPEYSVRQLLLGFMSNNMATNGVDYGYDALIKDNFPNDMSFIIEDDNYIIQGVGDFDINNRFPLNIDLATSGTIEIKLAELENFEEDIDVFIYDAFEGTYTKFNDVSFQITLDSGTYNDRFFLVFQEDSTLSTIDNELKDIVVNYHQSNSEIYIHTPSSIQVKQVHLINVVGQTVASWNATNLTLSNEIKIPIKSISEGNYIVNVETSHTTQNKKIIIKH
jgi:hypothetical protein